MTSLSISALRRSIALGLISMGVVALGIGSQVAHVVNVFLYRDGGNDWLPLVGGEQGSAFGYASVSCGSGRTSRSLLDFPILNLRIPFYHVA